MQERQATGEQPSTQDQRPLYWLFLRRRMIIALLITLALIVMAVIEFLATGHIIDFIWFYITPILFVLFMAIIALYTWLFPQNAISQQSPSLPNSSPSYPAVSTVVRPVTQSAPIPSLPIINVFHFDETHLPSFDEFYGRVYERQILIDRTRKRSSTAIVGEYRIGKSWLMQYLKQIAPEHPLLGTHVRVGKLSATNPQCWTVAGFVKKVLDELNMSSYKPNAGEIPLQHLGRVIRRLKELNIIPVLCVDEFAGLLGKPSFDKSFLNGLRAIAEDEGLVLITASRDPLHTVIENIIGETSPLFNIMPELTLKPFTKAEAEEFITVKGQSAGLNQEEQQLCLECAALLQPGGISGWPPLRLQLAGYLLFADKHLQVVGQRAYTPSDLAYQADFQRRVDEQYQAVMRHS